MSRRVLVCDIQMPFATEDPVGSWVDRLVETLHFRNLIVDLVRIPSTSPSRRGGKDAAPDLASGPRDTNLFDAALIWRMLDFTSGGGDGVDLLLATRFPSYLARHPNKTVWLLDRPPDDPSAPGDPVPGTGLRRGMDRRVLGEARRVFAGSAEVARAVQEEAGLDAPVLPVPADGAEAWDEVVDQLTSTL